MTKPKMIYRIGYYQRKTAAGFVDWKTIFKTDRQNRVTSFLKQMPDLYSEMYRPSGVRVKVEQKVDKWPGFDGHKDSAVELICELLASQWLSPFTRKALIRTGFYNRKVGI